MPFKCILEPIIGLYNRVFGEKGIFVLFIVLLLIYCFVDTFFNRFNYNLNTPIQNWVDTAVYFNNILSPILLLATVFLLYWTWKDTKRGLDLQRSDALYTSIIATLERSSNELKKELQNCKIKELGNVQVKTCLELLGQRYLNERHKRHLDSDSRINYSNRALFIEHIRKSTTQINGFGCVLNQLYLVLDNAEHHNAFKINLYSLFSMQFLIGFVIIQIRVQRLIKELDEPDLENQDLVIKILIETISISYKDKGLDKELFDDKFINEFLDDTV